MSGVIEIGLTGHKQLGGTRHYRHELERQAKMKLPADLGARIPLCGWAASPTKKYKPHIAATEIVNHTTAFLKNKYGLDDPVFAMELSMYKTSIELYLIALSSIFTDGISLCKPNKDGGEIRYANPAWRAMTDAARQILVFTSRYGLSPALTLNREQLEVVSSDVKEGNNWLRSKMNDEDDD